MAKKPTERAEIPESPPGLAHLACEAPGHSGYVVVADPLTPDEYLRWYENDRARRKREEADEGESRHVAYDMIEDGWHLIREWHIDGLNEEHLAKHDGTALPSWPLVVFVAEVISWVVVRNSSRPTLQPR